MDQGPFAPKNPKVPYVHLAQQSWLHLIKLSQLNPDYQLSDKVVDGEVEERQSETVAAEKDDMVRIGVEQQAIGLLACHETCLQHHEACFPILLLHIEV